MFVVCTMYTECSMKRHQYTLIQWQNEYRYRSSQYWPRPTGYSREIQNIAMGAYLMYYMEQNWNENGLCGTRLKHSLLHRLCEESLSTITRWNYRQRLWAAFRVLPSQGIFFSMSSVVIRKVFMNKDLFSTKENDIDQMLIVAWCQCIAGDHRSKLS